MNEVKISRIDVKNSNDESKNDGEVDISIDHGVSNIDYDPVFFSLEEIRNYECGVQDTTFTLYSGCRIVDVEDEAGNFMGHQHGDSNIECSKTGVTSSFMVPYCITTAALTSKVQLEDFTLKSMKILSDCASEIVLFTVDRLRFALERHYSLPIIHDKLSHLRNLYATADNGHVEDISFLEHGYMQSGRSMSLLSIEERLTLLYDCIALGDTSHLIVKTTSDNKNASLPVVSTPPQFALNSSCQKCERRFSISCFRHHCRNCGLSFCTVCSNSRSHLPHFGYTMPVRVCELCMKLLQEELHRQLLLWRLLRTKAYFVGSLQMYPSVVIDRSSDKAFRILRGVLEVARGTFSLTYPTRIVLETVEATYQHGWTGIAGIALHKDFLEALRILSRSAGFDNMDLSFGDLTACIYYKMALNRGRRGRFPSQEHQDHLDEAIRMHQILSQDDDDGILHSHIANDDKLNEAIRLAPLALVAVYEESTADVQRIALSQGWSTLWARLESKPEQPAYALFAHDRQGIKHGKSPGKAYDAYLKKNVHTHKKGFGPSAHGSIKRDVVLSIRGTHSISDVVTDIRASPVEFSPDSNIVHAAWRGSTEESSQKEFDAVSKESAESGANKACRGVAHSALWLLRQLGPTLLHFHEQGHNVILTGHSLGGAVASLLTLLMKNKIPEVKCWTYGSPACVDEVIAKSLEDSVTSIVLGDDVIPRITPQSIGLLMKDLECSKTDVLTHLSDDWAAVLHRVGTLWSPRLRESSCQIHSKEDQGQFDEISEECCEYECGLKNDIVVDEFVLVDYPDNYSFSLPGKIIHIYKFNGCYKASTVMRDFQLLKRIDIQGTMFEDHRAKRIFEALLEVRAVRCREAVQPPPQWTSFDFAETCTCCHNDFSWHSTFRSEAQGFRDKHNCHMCGSLCCGPCSAKKCPIPKIGLVNPVRVCDQCFYAGDYAAL